MYICGGMGGGERGDRIDRRIDRKEMRIDRMEGDRE